MSIDRNRTSQRTLTRSVSMRGVGLHSGQLINLSLHPAQPSCGIQFRRMDLPHKPAVAARWDNVFNTQMATSLGTGRTVIGTVEHLMAAFYGFGIDNAWVELDGPEVPVFDGSAKVFAELLDAAGISFQAASKTVLKLKKKVELRVADKWAVAEPSESFELHSTIDWDHPSIGFQEFHYYAHRTPFQEIASARTFGFLRDVEKLKSIGLARGGSLDNAIVLNDGGVLNPDGLRCPDEFVKHKVLDALGDLKLAQHELQMSIRIHRGGHEVHSQLLQKIFSSPEHYTIAQVRKEAAMPSFRPSRQPVLARA